VTVQLTMLKAKIHRATVTEADLGYEGSISIDRALLEAAGLLVHERVDVYNCNNGERFSTYIIPGSPGEICLNGAAARKVLPGDQVIIAAYVQVNEREAEVHEPVVVFVDGENRITR
jgi:aspartate 1-decarboxylase